MNTNLWGVFVHELLRKGASFSPSISLASYVAAVRGACVCVTV